MITETIQQHPIHPIKVMIADDHHLFADGLRTMLAAKHNIEIVALATDGNDVLRKLNSYYVDILLLDIQMPNSDGVATAEQMRERFPDVKIIVVSMFGEKTFIEKMFRIGVHGYLLKNTSIDELVLAIDTVHNGKKYFAQDVTSIVLGTAKATGVQTDLSLTKRETEVLKLIAKGYNTSGIAKELNLSPLTVGTHRKNLMQKLNINNAAGLVRYAMLNGIVD